MSEQKSTDLPPPSPKALRAMARFWMALPKLARDDPEFRDSRGARAEHLVAEAEEAENGKRS